MNFSFSQSLIFSFFIIFAVMKQLLSLLLLSCILQVEAAVYNITDFGAKNDTTVLSTQAIQAAIDRCSQEGGGQVLVPAGHYKMGTIVLRSKVNLHLEKGAILFGSTDINDYTPHGPLTFRCGRTRPPYN